MTDSKLKIEAEKRSVLGKKVSKLRREGKLPAVVYGSGIDSMPIVIDTKEFIKLYKDAGESTIVDLVLDGVKDLMKVLIKDIDVDYVKRKILHVSFYKVNMNEAITATIPLFFEGEAPSEKTGAVILTNIDEVEVKCLPSNLPEHLVIDLSVLDEIGKSVTFADLKMPKGVELLKDEDELSVSIVTATAPVTEEEEAAKLEAGSADVTAVESTVQGESEDPESSEAEVTTEE